jgi:MFS family permease
MLSLQNFVPYLLGLTIAASIQAHSAQYWSIEKCALIVGALLALRIPMAFLIPERAITHRKMADEHKQQRRLADKVQNDATRQSLGHALRAPGLWVLLGYIFYLILTPGINIQLYYFEKGYLLFNDYTIGLLVRWSSAGVLAGLLFFAALSRYITVRTLVWGAFLMDCASYPAWYFMHGLWAARIILLVTGFFGILYGMFLNTLAARATPKGLEGTIYSLIAAAIALAGNLSNKLGTFLYDYFGPANHHSIIHGWNMSLAVGFAFTIVGFVFIPFLPHWTRSNLRLSAAKEIENEELAEQPRF